MLRQFIQAMHGLKAGESMRLATAIAVGTGSMKPAKVRSIVNEWGAVARMAFGVPERHQTKKGFDSMMSKLGLVKAG